VQAFYVYALGASIFAELAGGVLFVLGSGLGAYLLVRTGWLDCMQSQYNLSPYSKSSLSDHVDGADHFFDLCDTNHAQLLGPQGRI
jgi:hypothetical protein